MFSRTFHTGGIWLVRCVVVFCMVLAAAVMYARLAGYEFLSVQSDSMAPAVRKGDVVLISRRLPDPHPGEIVSFISPIQSNVLITHRVIGVDATRGIISTKGDDAAVPDDPVPAWNVRGTVRRVIPRMGVIFDTLKHPLGLAVVLYVPAIGIITAEIRRLSMYYATGRQTTKAVHYMLRPRRSS